MNQTAKPKVKGVVFSTLMLNTSTRSSQLLREFCFFSTLQTTRATTRVFSRTTTVKPIHNDSGPLRLPTVVNIRTLRDNIQNHVYIGRSIHSHKLAGSKWANPYRLKQGCPAGSTLKDYEAHVRNNKILLNDLHELEGKSLMCWCTPKPCHGHVLQRLVAERCLDPWEMELFFGSERYEELRCTTNTTESDDALISLKEKRHIAVHDTVTSICIVKPIGQIHVFADPISSRVYADISVYLRGETTKMRMIVTYPTIIKSMESKSELLLPVESFEAIRIGFTRSFVPKTLNQDAKPRRYPVLAEVIQ